MRRPNWLHSHAIECNGGRWRCRRPGTTLPLHARLFLFVVLRDSQTRGVLESAAHPRSQLAPAELKPQNDPTSWALLP